MSTVILAPTSNAAGATTTSAAQSYGLDAVLQASATNPQFGLTAPVIATLLLSADGTNYVAVPQAISFPTGGASTPFVGSFTLADYANAAIGGISPPWSNYKVRFAGNLGAAATVGLVGDSGLLSGGSGGISLTTTGTGAATLISGTLNIPTPSAGGVTSVAGRTGVVVLASGDVSGLAASATTDATNASNIGSGTLPAARLPANTLQTATFGSTTTIPLSSNLNDKWQVTLTGNTTIALTGGYTGQVWSLLVDFSGSFAITWFTTIRWAAGGTAPTQTSVNGKADLYVFEQISSGVWIGSVGGQNY